MPLQLTITMTPATVQGLQDETYALYFLASVRYGPRLSAVVGFGGGYPLIWSRLTTYLQTTTIAFDDAPYAYISTTPLAENAQVTIGDSTPVAIGQTVHVNSSGQLSVLTTGSSGTVSIINDASQVWTCGLAQVIGGGIAPVCAFPLHGNAMDMIAPTTKILAMFAIDSIVPGLAITTAYSPGFLIDFQAETLRTVSFDIDQGWSAGDAAWAKPVAAGTDLGKLLIGP